MVTDPRVEAMLAEIRGHKAAIRQHRSSLRRCKAELGVLQEELSRLGIGLVIQAKREEPHGRTDPFTRHPR
jgi:hypothetical protein